MDVSKQEKEINIQSEHQSDNLYDFPENRTNYLFGAWTQY